ncbi:MAG TPA: ElyC/SanA/YdcF family protein [Bryobacteraceae bacterium]|nr:ElyC/SanA/YdcF family protein [Bryobacteraceae bacterium]
MTYTEPLLTIFCAIAFLGLWRLRRARGAWVAMLGVAGLFLLSWPPADWVFSRPLEMWYPARPFGATPVQAIVVFSSSVAPPIRERPYPLPDEQTYQRCRYAAWLYHQRPEPVLVCGGGSPGQAPYSSTMRSLLEESGVPPDSIWVEEHSHSTHENALYGARILQQHGIGSVALVVDAVSMPRAAACLRKSGIQVLPASSEFREFDMSRGELLPNWRAVRQNEATLHEVGGLLWYWLRGWI